MCSMCVCVSVSVCVCVYIYIYIYDYSCMNDLGHIHVYTHACMSLYACASKLPKMYINVSAKLMKDIYIYIYIYIYYFVLQDVCLVRFWALIGRLRTSLCCIHTYIHTYKHVNTILYFVMQDDMFGEVLGTDWLFEGIPLPHFYIYVYLCIYAYIHAYEYYFVMQDDMFGEVLGTDWPYDDIPPPVSKFINVDEDDDLVAPNGEGVFFAILIITEGHETAFNCF